MRNLNRWRRFSSKDPAQLSKDVRHALSRMVDEKSRHESTRPPRFQVGPETLIESYDLVLIPRVPNAGFKLGRVTMLVVSALAQGTSSNHWDFSVIQRRRLEGVSVERILETFSTESFGLVAFVPYELELDEVLREGDILVLRADETGFGGVIHSLSVQVDERYGS